jgi:hypothetical protein
MNSNGTFLSTSTLKAKNISSNSQNCVTLLTDSGLANSTFDMHFQTNNACHHNQTQEIAL